MQRQFQMTFQGLLTGVLLLCFSARAETPLIPLPPGLPVENSNRDVAVGSPVSLTGPEVQRDEPPSGEHYGNCGYGNYITPWLLNTDGNGGLAEEDLASSTYYRCRRSSPGTGEWKYDIWKHFTLQTGLGEAGKLSPGTYDFELESHVAWCTHPSDDWEGTRCSFHSKEEKETASSIRVVRLDALNGPYGFILPYSAPPVSPVPPLLNTPFLSLPVRAASSTAEFSLTPYPAGAWPPGTPRMMVSGFPGLFLMNEVRDSVQIPLDTSTTGWLNATCGVSALNLQLYVVGVGGFNVAEIQPSAPGAYSPSLYSPSVSMLPNADASYRIFRRKTGRLKVTACSNPSLTKDKLPGCRDSGLQMSDGWKLEGGEGDDPLERTLDLSVPRSHGFTASCGVSRRTLDVHVCDLKITPEKNLAAVQTGGTAMRCLILTVPDVKYDADDGTDRRVPVRLEPFNLAVLEGLDLPSYPGMAPMPVLPPGGQQPDMAGQQEVRENHGTLYAECSYGLRFCQPGETPGQAEEARANYGQQAVRRIDNLSLENATEVFVEAMPQNIAGAARGTITLHYESQAASFTETLEVVIADTRASLLSRYMLVNDDNDDMLAYPWNTPESRKTSPFNAEMDKDQPTAVDGEDDLRMVRFSAPTGCYPLLVQKLHLDVSGGIRLWKDSRRQEELTRRDWTELEISAQPLLMSPSCCYGCPMTELTVWVEGLAASAQPGDAAVTATWTLGGVPLTEKVPLTVLEMRMAVDGGKNRGDTTIPDILVDDFGTVSVPGDFGNYRCLFWPNDDHDTLHYEAEHFGDSNAWHEDDDPKFQHGTGHPNCMDNTIGAKQGKYKQTGNHSRDNHGSTEYVPLPDSQSHCLRDLEDFNRLHLKLSPLFALVDGIQFHLTGAPVNIFEAIDPSLNYITKNKVGNDQICKLRLLEVGGQNSRLPDTVLKLDGSITPFIWEGRNVSDSDLVLSARLPDGTVIGQRKVRIVLESITAFFDVHRHDCVQQTPYMPVPSRLERLQQTPDQYLLFVYGFNVSDYEKQAWPGTIYKRLWWQGFKGRVGVFVWPCKEPFWGAFAPETHLTGIYDDSDYIAWQNGWPLAQVLKNLLDGPYGENLHVLAHSEGNVVLGEALRRLDARRADGRKIRTYIATQAAISISHYTQVSGPYFEEPGYKKGGLPHSTPDVCARYPGWPDKSPYLASVVNEGKAVKFCNFFNEDDFALVSAKWTSWEDNNQMHPNMNYHYHGNPDVYDENASPGSCFWYLFGGRLRFPECMQHPEGFRLGDVKDTYEIFSFAAEAWGIPLGSCSSQHPCASKSSPLSKFKFFDLQQALNYDDRHYCHSKQFRSNIIDEWGYWQQVKQECHF